MAKRERTPLNAPGPFFTEKDQCISCGAPEAEAPDLMAFDEAAGSCYFRRQPVTSAEVERACQAVWASCCGAVQYDGNDRAILARLHALDQRARLGHPADGGSSGGPGDANEAVKPTRAPESL